MCLSLTDSIFLYKTAKKSKARDPALYATALKGGCVLIKILSENLKLILTGMISILMILTAAVVISLYFGGSTERQLVVSEINGDVYITRNGKRMSISKNSRLKSGDVLVTGENGSARLSMDGDKYVFAEPNTSVYIYFTDISSRGEISVNLSRGAVICEINKPLKKNASFVLKTPNSSASVRGTVFRAAFGVEESFMGYNDVMVTEIQNFDGSVSLQLYDSGGEAFDLPMILVERTSAQMITCEELCKYGYLNYDIRLLSLKEITLYEIIRAQNEGKLAFSGDEISLAYKSIIEENRRLATETTVSDTKTPDESTTVSKETTTVSSKTETYPTETSVPEESSSQGTLRSTYRTYEVSTYSGVPWWNITGNTNTDMDDYEDWFAEDDPIVTTAPF